LWSGGAAEAERTNLENQIEPCLKETDIPRQLKDKEISDHHVNESGFNPFQARIIHFQHPNLEERELLCSVFTLMHPVLWLITMAARSKA
jgi:hypothetical protein